MDMHDPATGEVREAHPGMPPAIAAAIIAVKKQVKQLGADDKNEHAKYAFVSVDKFYERIGKLMAEAGLALLIDETSSDVREGKSGNPWLFVHYDCRMMHESGAISPPMRRSCALPISGPQAFGAAQSYIEKQLLRQVFKVPTGEKDADDTAPKEQDAPGSRHEAATARGTVDRTQAYPARQQAAPAPSETQTDADKRWRELRAEIDVSMTVPEVEAVDGCRAWHACEAKIVEVEMGRNKTPEEAANVAGAAMEQLRRRIENRRDMLLQDEGGPR